MLVGACRTVSAPAFTNKSHADSWDFLYDSLRIRTNLGLASSRAVYPPSFAGFD
jgi:hypothetical protein